jgi:glycosyltransferase involved in cell wall biosynthesis
MTREELNRSYGSATCLVFPSRAASWGLPISEFLPTGKPMLLADLPYAHETATGAQQVRFFPACNATALADALQDLLEGRTDAFRPVAHPRLDAPFAVDWKDLFQRLLQDE